MENINTDQGLGAEIQPTQQAYEYNGKSYQAEELNSLIKLGEIGREAETRYNTKIENIWPDYTRKTQQAKEYQEKLTKYEQSQQSQQPQPQAQPQSNSFDPSILKQHGYLTRDEARELAREEYEQKTQTDRILNNVRELEGKYSGSDGRPKFNPIEILEYMQEEGIKDPEKAYKIKFDAELDQWRDSQKASKRGSGIYTETKTDAIKTPARVKVTDENIDQLLREAAENN